MDRRTHRIVNKLGLHMRAANVFCEVANRYACEVMVSRGDVRVNGKSIMGLMMLAAGCGTSIVVETSGDDEEKAAVALEELIAGGFGEELAETPEDAS